MPRLDPFLGDTMGPRRFSLRRLGGVARGASALAAAAILAAGSCGAGPPSTTSPRPAKPNLLLVTLDTTRADHLGCYGGRGADTPNLDRIAREGVLVEHSMSVAPLTLPSHSSILTSLWPPRHGARDNADFQLPDSATTLAEHFKAQGYATGAAVGTYILSSVFGVSQGFDTYDEPKEARTVDPKGPMLGFRDIVERPASQVTDAALSALERIGSRPFFLWVHYYDPHADYVPPSPYAERFRGSPYDGEIAYTDAQLGRLLSALARRGILDSTLVAVTADHGESLGEHGELTHGLFVYEATLHVPLLLRWPGVLPAGRRLTAVTSGVDLAPTLLELMSLPPLPEAQGRSFASAARGGPEHEREAAYAECILPERAYGWAALAALREGHRKFIEAPEPELYDLQADPGETKNLAPANPGQVADLRTRLREMVEQLGTPDGSATRKLDEEERAKLESLGYLGSPRSKRPGGSRPDPKRLVSLHNDLLNAEQLIKVGDRSTAAALVAKVLAADPGNPKALDLDGTLAFSAGRDKEGLARLEAAARMAPGTHKTLRNLANALQLAGRHEEAARTYRSAIALQPKQPEDHYGLGNVLFASKDVKGALTEYREAIRLGLDVPPVRAALGVALAASGDAAGAERELRSAIAGDPKLGGAWNQLGILAEKAGRLTEARDSYRRALETEPDHADALFNHGKVCLRLGDGGAAAESVRRLVTAHPEHPMGRYLEAQVLLASGDREGARQALRRFLEQKNHDPRLVGPARKTLAKLE